MPQGDNVNEVVHEVTAEKLEEHMHAMIDWAESVNAKVQITRRGKVS